MLARFVGAVLALGMAHAAAAQGLEVSDAWARASAGGAQAGAVYLTIQSPTADRLTATTTPAAQKAGLHTMSMDGGVMKMRELDGIDIPAGQKVVLKPGGLHIMLEGLAQPLREGQSFPLTLSFDKAGTRQVTVAVGKISADGPPPAVPNR